MRIAVVGTGAIGGTLAALLDRSGYEVAVTARGDTLEAIQRDGIHLDGAWGQHRARVRATQVLESTPDLALVCAKAQDAAAAISANALHLPAARAVVLVQNGLDGLDAARRLLPDVSWVGGIAVFAADSLAPAHVTVATRGPLLLGDGEGAASPTASEAARVLATALPAVAVTNFTGLQWTKLVINQLNAVPAITGLSVQEVLGDRRTRRLVAASMRETAVVGLSLGVHFGSTQGLSHLTMRLVSGPLPIAEALLIASRRRLGPTPVTGSTLQSIRRGRLTEIDHLSGAVVARARATGVATPVNSALTALVHEVERTHRFLSTAELVERVGPVRSRAGR